MNEFALASNRTLAIGDITLRQALMGEFDLFINHAHEIKAALQASDNDDLSTAQVFLSHSAQTVQLLLLLSNANLEQINKLSQDGQAILQIVLGLYHLNQAFFDEVPKPNPKQKEGGTWWESFQFLISQGHQHSQIMQYSYGAYVGYMEAAGRSYRHGLKAQANIMRTAYHADKSGMDKFNRELDKD